jgi:hypothetical protein
MPGWVRKHPDGHIETSWKMLGNDRPPGDGWVPIDTVNALKRDRVVKDGVDYDVYSLDKPDRGSMAAYEAARQWYGFLSEPAEEQFREASSKKAADAVGSDSPVPILGVRRFGVNQKGHLTGRNYRYEPGWNDARCDASPYASPRYGVGSWDDPFREYRELTHNPPDEKCNCGFFAFVDWPTAKEHRDEIIPGNCVMAVVEAKGTMELAEYGWRAEKMRVVAIIQTYEKVSVMGFDISSTGPLSELAERYDVPLIQADDVQLFMETRDAEILKPEPLADYNLVEARPNPLPPPRPSQFQQGQYTFAYPAVWGGRDMIGNTKPKSGFRDWVRRVRREYFFDG